MDEVKEMVKDITEKYGKSRDCLMPVLQRVVNEKKFISPKHMIEIAALLDLSAAEVYGTASFYSFLDTEKRGKYVIRVCKSIIAEMKGKKEIVKTLENLLKIKVGETTADGLFTLLETNDIGWSDKEPSMLINYTPYTELTSEKVLTIINEYRNLK